MNKTELLNYDREMGDLLNFVSRIAIQVRRRTWERLPATQDGRTSLETRGVEEIELLSDAIHNLNHIGVAMRAGDHAAVEDACVWHIDIFSDNARSNPDDQRWANPAIIDGYWAEGVRVFTAIRDKARLMRGSVDHE
jgi:hypothetical protein